MASKTSRGVALIPLTITYGVDRSDVTLPQSIPLVELLPGMVERWALSLISQRMMASRCARPRAVCSINPSLCPHRECAPVRRSPSSRWVRALPIWSMTTSPKRLVKSSKECPLLGRVRTLALLPRSPRRASSSSPPSSWRLLLRTPSPPWTPQPSRGIAGAIGIVAALLVTATSAVMTQKHPQASGIALAHTVPFLTAAAALRLSQSHWDTAGWGWTGLGLLIGSLAVLALPKRSRISIAAPLVVGTVLAATGLLVRLGQLSQAGISAILFALVIVLLQVAPWIALAHIPVRILDADTTEQIPAKGITDQISTSFVFVVALRAGGAIAALFLTVALMTAPETRSVSLPLTLIVLGAVSLVLQTRSIRARVEVLLGALTGLIVILVAAVLGAYADPRTMPWLTLSAIATALVLVITNVVGPRARPHLTRIADTISVLSLFVLLPLAVYLWS